MEIRRFRAGDGPALGALAQSFARGETDFVLNPLWETEDELAAEFERHGIRPEDHVLVADDGDGGVLGMSGFLRFEGESVGALLAPIVEREERGHGVGGRLLRAALELGPQLGLALATAALGSRNRSGQALLTAYGFRPVRQSFFMQCDERPKQVAPPAGVELSAAGSADRDAVLELYTEAGFPPRTADSMRAAFEDGRHDHVVARHGGEVIGFVELETHWPRRVWVSYVGVRPALRQRGLGSALVSWALDRQFQGRAERAMLMLSPANRAALRAYEKVGFGRFRLIDILERAL